MEQTSPGSRRTATDVIAQRVRELRNKRGWSAQRLAEEMAAIGWPWERMVVTKLENGRRQSVSVEEWLALAYLLDVAPIHLLIPLDDGYVQILPQAPKDEHRARDAVVTTSQARKWIAGDPDEGALPGTDLRVYVTEVDEATFRERFGRGSQHAGGGDG